MKWIWVFLIVGSTVAGDLLQAFEMRRSGEITDFRAGALGRLARQIFSRWRMVLAVVFMAVSFFSLLELLKFEDLSFAVPATALSLVVETFLAGLILGEHVDRKRWAGAILVAAGVALLAIP